jgi:pyruvate/2-oxoglutarate dehydrogenase complex dihydrolipoamide acyltransferase (E2) component
MHPVHIPHELVNDESVLLVDWLVDDGAKVSAGQPIAVIETSKTTTEVQSSHEGYLRRAVPKGSEVRVGAVFCHIAQSPEETAIPEHSPPVKHAAASASAPANPEPPSAKPILDKPSAQNAAPAPAPESTRFSRRALELIEKRGLSKDLFARKGLVREQDVLALIDGKTPASPNGAPAPAKSRAADSAPPIPASGVPVRVEDLPRIKQLEAKYLSSGFHNTLTSVITVSCPAAGLKAAAKLQPELGRNSSALIVYEAARLLKKFPLFNAFHHQGKVNYYEQVNIGLAVDADLGLKVPVIHNAAEKSVLQIAQEVENLLMAYLNNEIPVAALSGGTFTITNLSSEEVFAFHPLINQGQSAILGVGAETRSATESDGHFNLILAFDHQLAEGRMAARFLRELRDRIASYGGALNSIAETFSNTDECSRCHRPAQELASLKVPLLDEIGPLGRKLAICRDCLLKH